jgi:hypothetical protein
MIFTWIHLFHDFGKMSLGTFVLSRSCRISWRNNNNNCRYGRNHSRKNFTYRSTCTKSWREQLRLKDLKIIGLHNWLIFFPSWNDFKNRIKLLQRHVLCKFTQKFILEKQTLLGENSLVPLSLQVNIISTNYILTGLNSIEKYATKIWRFFENHHDNRCGSHFASPITRMTTRDMDKNSFYHDFLPKTKILTICITEISSVNLEQEIKNHDLLWTKILKKQVLLNQKFCDCSWWCLCETISMTSNFAKKSILYSFHRIQHRDFPCFILCAISV